MPFGSIWTEREACRVEVDAVTGVSKVIPRLLQPLMTGKGFIDSAMKDATTRSYVDEIYQTIMRTRARSYKGEPVSCVVMVPDAMTVEALRTLMPGVRIETDDKAIQGYLSMMEMDIAELVELNDEDLQRLLGDTDKSPTGIERRYEVLKEVVYSLSELA